MKHYCDICNQECKDPVHLPIYVIGSEGVKVCLNCRIALAEYIRQLRSVASIARKQGYKAGRDSNSPIPNPTPD